ncbi:hypothetical protein DYB37_001372 [Aphanomyces astaci]|uniref:cysteine--tRNA ligase n=1 Tax=Aphanomyces astaci TaxID=112090 RepID=A0A3R6XM64_APHAT|nr:hypothetical protein DYB35_010394 [Aphanomyces astaci]RHZ25877.1 hypothetical protein DYB37_001372 [Aphanomyces astaci]
MSTSAAATAAPAKKGQPTWYMPQPMNSLMEYWERHYPLKLYNSMTRTKTTFVPMQNKRVLWYMCGPTVYDITHLGHGRTYTCFDYVRRILEDYFGYQVELVMNITDVDDKIIVRAAENGWTEAHPGQSLPANKDEAAKVVLAWASEQSAESNMQRTNDLSKFFEKTFMDDMAALNIKPPTVLTRVSEYMPEIVEFVEGIIANGYAYESNGSVYFDTIAFGKAKGKNYGKLVPENVGQSDLLAEGEGSLSVGATDKRNGNDFALWKKSKRGEPFWASPWGEGRPGWHIECSAMASDALKHLEGGRIDIHTGGVDLRFPHHDNEIAQSEAYFNFGQWINYFVHTGHLNIEGLKMSKSLKNFVKINQALEHHTPRQLRFLFLLHKYNVPMDYNDNTMDEAVGVDVFFTKFFQNVKATLRGTSIDRSQKWAAAEKALGQAVLHAKDRVHQALADDLDTPLALRLLQELAKDVNRYVASSPSPVSLAIRSAADYITRILRIFGLIPNGGGGGGDIGFPLEGAAGGGGQEAILAPVLDIFSDFRDQVRAVLFDADATSLEHVKQTLMALCDNVRDAKLPHAGVRLEDKSGGKAVWKLADKDVLLAEIKAKEDEKAAKEAAKAQRAADELQKIADERQRAQTHPKDLFKASPEYVAFNDQGLPTALASGEPVAKSLLKKLAKEQDKHQKLYDKYHK